MGVYIKNMEKPTSCDVCQFMRSCGKWTAKFVEYNGKNGKTWIPTYPIPEICPLVEIKTPHGRLVDESEIHTGIRMEKNTEYRYFIDRVNAPTVIESEGKQ